MSQKPPAPDLRLPAAVIALAALTWLGGLALGGTLGLAPRFAILLDLACMAAFIWALAVIWRAWQSAK